MSITSVLWHDRDEIVRSFHFATMYGMVSTWMRCERLATTPQEPDFVAGLVIESTPLIHSTLNAVLSPRNISVSVCSVFCHQTPQVTFGSRSSVSCELGDILFAYVHTPRNGDPVRNALLFQAKASARQPYRIHTGEVDQLRLYRDWPNFEYTRSSFLSGQKRMVTPKAPHAGAQYLLIDDRSPSERMSGLLGFPGTYPVGCCMPDELLQDHSHLAAELFNLFTFRTGRPFEDRTAAATRRDWSQVVWDLLDTGVKKSFRRKNSGRQHNSRSAGDTVEMLDGTTFARASSGLSCCTASDIVGPCLARRVYGGDDDVPPEDGDRGSDFQEPEAGVSVVLIETSERESEG
jgi:hypothetical protein